MFTGHTKRRNSTFHDSPSTLPVGSMPLAPPPPPSHSLMKNERRTQRLNVQTDATADEVQIPAFQTIPTIAPIPTISSASSTSFETEHDHDHDPIQSTNSLLSSLLPSHIRAAPSLPAAHESTPLAPVTRPPPTPLLHSSGGSVHDHAADVHKYTRERFPHHLTPPVIHPPVTINGQDQAYNKETTRQLHEPKKAALAVPGLVTNLYSPDGVLKLSVLLNEEGRLGYMVESKGQQLFQPAFIQTSVNNKECTFKSDNPFGSEVHWLTEAGESWWRPVPGSERRHYHAKYQSVKVWCQGAQCQNCKFVSEYRVYNNGIAMRSLVDAISAYDTVPDTPADPESEYASVEFNMDVRLPTDLQPVCWAQNMEEPYVTQLCSYYREPVMTPVTMALNPPESSKYHWPTGGKAPSSYVTILQAAGPAFMRSTANVKRGQNNMFEILTHGEAPLHPDHGQLGVVASQVLGLSTATSWNVLLVGDEPGELVESNYIISLLNDPPSSAHPHLVDSRWVPNGKSLRVRGHSTEKAIHLIDFAAAHNYQIVHFDAGWYGDENNKTNSACYVYPEYQSMLNIPEVCEYAKKRGIKISLYVNEIALRDTERLTQIYPNWGVAGVKFGFVDVNSPRAMRILHERMLTFGHVGMFVNIHDIYRPRGLSRTYPHLITQEGVRGEERKPDASHHTILPFVRYLQGSADYTPRYLIGSGIKCTRAHQLALPFILFSPIQSLFWAEPGNAIMEAVKNYFPELIVWQQMPTTWDDTRVLHGRIGEYVSMARRSGQDWFVGTVTNEESRTLRINLTELFLDLPAHPNSFFPSAKRGYYVHVYADDDWSGATDLNSVKVRPRLTYILPPQVSTHRSAYAMKMIAANAPFAISSSFPSDPFPYHLQSQQMYRTQVLSLQAEQWANLGHRSIPIQTEFEELEDGTITAKLAPSGGHVMFITPIPEPPMGQETKAKTVSQPQPHGKPNVEPAAKPKSEPSAQPKLDPSAKLKVETHAAKTNVESKPKPNPKRESTKPETKAAKPKIESTKDKTQKTPPASTE